MTGAGGATEDAASSAASDLTLPFSSVDVGSDRGPVHQLHHPVHGKVYILTEVAQTIFAEPALKFRSDVRAGKYPKVFAQDRAVLRTITALGLPQETDAVAGVTLLFEESIVALMRDRRRAELIEPFRFILLKMASQEAARLMAEGKYDMALPAATDAVRIGQIVFKESCLNLFPLYLLAAQACLGLRRAQQCEEFLNMANWLALKEPQGQTCLMRSQLSRLYGQLNALKGSYRDALQAFCEDVLFSSKEFGVEDPRTSLGYYNMAKVFYKLNRVRECLACCDQALSIWKQTFTQVLFSDEDYRTAAAGKALSSIGETQVLEIKYLLDDTVEMKKELLGDGHHSMIGDLLTTAMASMHVKSYAQATEFLRQAGDLLKPRQEKALSALYQRIGSKLESALNDRK